MTTPADTTRIVVILRPKPRFPGPLWVLVRRALKCLLHGFGLIAVTAEELPPGAAPNEGAYP